MKKINHTKSSKAKGKSPGGDVMTIFPVYQFPFRGRADGEALTLRCSTALER